MEPTGRSEPRHHTLSEDVQSFIDQQDRESEDELSPQEPEWAAEWAAVYRTILKEIAENIIGSRETITHNRPTTFENLMEALRKVTSGRVTFSDSPAAVEKLVQTAPDLIERLLDEHFTRNAIAEVRCYVRRTLDLSRLEGSRVPSKVTDAYLVEAARTYILGLPQASVALCRAALEQALKENIGYQGTPPFVRMNELLKKAEGAGIIDNTIRSAIREVADEANDVLHVKPTDLAKAYDVLVKVRGVLQHLYAN
jgi:hypothetical protein